MNSLNSLKHRVFFSLAVVSLLLPGVLQATAQSAPATWNETDTMRIVKETQKALSSLTNFGVFDDLHFVIQGKTLILRGYASRPTLKSSAEDVTKKIVGVESVKNEIEVLPNSPNDDRIRAAVYNRIYSNPVLRKYNANAGGSFRGLSVGRMAGGITVDPPIGFHAIHIIVKNGNVILRGAVLNHMDSEIAQIQANATPGVFSVENELGLENAGTAAKAK